MKNGINRLRSIQAYTVCNLSLVYCIWRSLIFVPGNIRFVPPYCAHISISHLHILTPNHPNHSHLHIWAHFDRELDKPKFLLLCCIDILTLEKKISLITSFWNTVIKRWRFCGFNFRVTRHLGAKYLTNLSERPQELILWGKRGILKL